MSKTIDTNKQKSEEREPILRLTRKDFDVQTFTAGGPGGQHQNKTASGVRITHIASGATGECRTTRSQLQNKEIAFKLLVASDRFQKWIKFAIAESDGVLKAAEEYADREINTPSHIQVQVKRDGKWVDEGSEDDERWK